MKLVDLFELVKEDSLTKDKLEEFHKVMSDLYAQMHLEMAEIKKRKAFFLVNKPEESVAQRKINWDITEYGQREMELKGYIRATSTHLRSLKSRLYSQY